MTDTTLDNGVRFGRTIIVPAAGDLVNQPVGAVVYAANRRGVMGTGFAGSIRLAGGVEVEREAMTQAPLQVGTAVLTTSGRLADRGIQAVIHAVVNDALGAPTKVEPVRRAIQATLRLADQHRIRTIALPPIGSGTGPGRLSVATVTDALVEEMVAYLRRETSRIERIVLVSRFDQDVVLFADAINRARGQWWRARG